MISMYSEMNVNVNEIDYFFKWGIPRLEICFHAAGGMPGSKLKSLQAYKPSSWELVVQNQQRIFSEMLRGAFTMHLQEMIELQFAVPSLDVPV